MPTRRGRMERHAERRREWAESRDRKRDAALKASPDAVAGIPFGQPILVGHHSERRHRKALERQERKGFESVEHSRMGEHHRTRAANIERQLSTSVFSDDHDAIERLEERIAEREAERDVIKAMNATLRRWRRGKPKDAMPSVEEIKALEIDGPAYLKYVARAQQHLPAHLWEARVPSYALSNLSSNIRRDQQRLDQLRAAREKASAQLDCIGYFEGCMCRDCVGEDERESI